MEITIYFIIGIVLLIIALFFYTIRNDKKEALKKLKAKPRIDFDEGQKVLDYLDRIIKDKYRYYLYTYFLPIYLDKKIPEKKTVDEIKKKIYVSVVGGITRETKDEILKYFTEKGIEIYINEKIMVFMNETDFQAEQKVTETFRDLKPELMEKVMP